MIHILIKDLAKKLNKIDQFAVPQIEVVIKGKTYKVSITDIRIEKDDDSGIKFAIMSNKSGEDEDE